MFPAYDDPSNHWTMYNSRGTRVEVHLLSEGTPKRPKSVRDLQALGMWADREEIRTA
jgi:hypothetical protein